MKLSFTHSPTPQDLAIFFRQLATFLAAGIPIVQSFELLSNSQEKPLLKNMLHTIKYEMETGNNLVDGLQKFPRYFDNLTCHLVAAGEQTGTLETMLKRIAHFREKSLLLKKRVKQALFYPAITFTVAMIISILMLTLIVPRFAELFKNMHGQLPAFTQAVLITSQLFTKYYWLSAIPCVGIIGFFYILKTSKKLQHQVDQFLLSIPFLKNVIKKIILARFTRNLATVFAAGIPIIDALKIVAHTTGNAVYTQAILQLRQRVLSGQQLHTAMQANFLFSTLSVQMVKVGEESGSLEAMLEKTAEIYESDIDHLVGNLSHLLEPLIMVILGVLIGGLVIALYLPIFKLGTII